MCVCVRERERERERQRYAKLSGYPPRDCAPVMAGRDGTRVSGRETTREKGARGKQGDTHRVARHGRVDLASVRGPVGHGGMQIALVGEDLMGLEEMCK